jgi:hypothetical protein
MVRAMGLGAAMATTDVLRSMSPVKYWSGTTRETMSTHVMAVVSSDPRESGGRTPPRAGRGACARGVRGERDGLRVDGLIMTEEYRNSVSLHVQHDAILRHMRLISRQSRLTSQARKRDTYPDIRAYWTEAERWRS